MRQFIVIFAVVAAFCYAEEEEPFSIGLGVLSPSYSQTVGKENVKVKFNQKENGQFSFSVGDPKTGNNQYLSFGPSAGQQQPSPAGYAAPAASYQAPVQAPSYQAPAQASYQAPALAAGYRAPVQGYQSPSAYQAPAQGYQSPSGYQAPAQGYQSPSLAAGYRAPSYGSSSGYGSPSSAYNSPSGYDYYGGSSAGKPEGDSPGILPAGFSYHGTEGQSFLRQSGELRKPQDNQGQIMPAGFSYHATEGQSFLRQGESPNFAIAEEKQSTGRGPAEESFYKNFQDNRQQGGRFLVNGLVGYGSGGPSRSLPIGGYAGAEFQGAHEEHGGHTE